MSSTPEMQVYGEVIMFVEAQFGDQCIQMVVYKQLMEVSTKLCTLRGKWNSQSPVEIAPIEAIVDIVGIWESEFSDWVYILRKHPGVELLHLEERGQVITETASKDN
jgi:hypothetical protein